MTDWSTANPFTGGLAGVTIDMSAKIETVTELPTEPATPGRINSQAKGKRAERMLANWWKSHGYPDAHRAVITGDRFAPDGGDLVLQHLDFRLVVEVKHHAGGLTDGQVAEYGAKLIRQTKQSNGTMGVLVERRDRVADPGRWWVHVDPYHFGTLVIGYPSFAVDLVHTWEPLACRTTVEYFTALLISAGHAERETT